MEWFNNMRIRYKLFVAFGILVSIACCFAIYAVTGLHNEGNRLNELINTYQARQIYMAEGIANIYRIRLCNFSKWYLTEGEEFIDDLSVLNLDHEAYIRLFSENLSAFRSLVIPDKRFTEAEKQQRIDLVDRIQALFDDYVRLTRELDAAAKNTDKNQMLGILTISLPVGNELSGNVRELRDLVFTAAKQKASETLDSMYHINDRISSASVAFIVFSVLILLFTVGNINRPISDIEKAVNEIARGNLSYPVRIARKDELGSLSNSIGDMVDRITEQNRRLEDLQKAAHAQAEKIREVHERTALMMDTTPICSMLWGKNDGVFDCNEETVRLFGTKDKQEFIDRFADFSSEYQPGDRPSLELADMYIKKAFEEGKYTFEWMHQSLDGTPIPCEITLFRVRYDDDDIVAAYVRDLREYRKMMGETLRLQAEREAALEKAQESDHAKSRFLATMSHEIRTPMNAILGVTEIQLRDETLAPDIREALVKIYSSGDLLLGIINDILDLSKIEAEKLDLSPHRYETASLINDTVSLNLMRIGSKQIEFVLSVDENTPAILIGDDLRIKQILNNLLSNAFKYTSEGVVRLSVSAKAGSEGKNETILVFRVSDTGQGMTEEQLAMLFDEYTRFNMEANRTTEGAGLGMNIARSLVNMMNGSISVKSEVNRGTVFTVNLPQGSADSRVLGKELAESLQNQKLDSAKQFRKSQTVYEPMPYGRVLIVDDAESNLYVAKGLLAPFGLSITTAASGFEAIEKIKDGNVYDIVFMDHMMPKMDGVEATGIIRGLGYTHTIVALTANAVAGQADMFLANGFDDFISKPIDTRRLAVVLKNYIRDKQPPEVIEAARKLMDPLNERRLIAANPPAEKPPVDPQLIEFFLKDASNAINVLEDTYKKHGDCKDEDIRVFTTAVHAMKSALGNIGEPALSGVAAQLENAGRDKDIAVILLEIPAFLTDLRAKIAELSSVKEADGTSEPVNEDYAFLREKLLALKEACEAYDRKNEKAIMAELRKKTWPSSIRESLGAIDERLLNGDVDEVSSLVDKIIASLFRAASSLLL